MVLSHAWPGEGLVRRTAVRLRPDPSRVVSQLFVAGEEVSSGASRATTVMRRVLDLSDDQVDATLASVLQRFHGRHPHLGADLLLHFGQIRDRVEAAEGLSEGMQMLLGAYATSEYAIEATALCNPSIVAHPDQTGLGAGELRFVLSLRAVGEGHVSSIEFRTGTLGPGDEIDMDDPGPLTVVGTKEPASYDRGVFAALLERPGSDQEVASMVLDRLPSSFSRTELESSIAAIQPHVLGRRVARQMIERIRGAADSNYTVSFPLSSALAQRVLRPNGPTEVHGMEDARFVRFVDDGGHVTYYATYTAFDGAHVVPQLLATEDFRTFSVSQLAGRAATNKGMALFPRRIGGRFAALSRWDRECNAVATSADGHAWPDASQVQSPDLPWELVQVGNCGSPMETPEGWLVITHGVGPMRTYCLGAMLLDLDDPRLVRGKLTAPLLEPEGRERDGYVPNVVYSCGALVHGDSVVLPYASGDTETTFALVSLPGLLERLVSR
jgi:predicted GH43/DUF377 family glycosyl hydrolase